MYHLLQYKHWFFPNFELKNFLDSRFTPCSRQKQENSTDYISGSNSDKKESARASVETNKQTNSICQSREFEIYHKSARQLKF